MRRRIHASGNLILVSLTISHMHGMYPPPQITQHVSSSSYHKACILLLISQHVSSFSYQIIHGMYTPPHMTLRAPIHGMYGTSRVLRCGAPRTRGAPCSSIGGPLEAAAKAEVEKVISPPSDV
jgi:hypothetical protein